MLPECREKAATETKAGKDFRAQGVIFWFSSVEQSPQIATEMHLWNLTVREVVLD